MTAPDNLEISSVRPAAVDAAGFPVALSVIGTSCSDMSRFTRTTKRKPGPKPDTNWPAIKEKYVQGVDKDGKRYLPTLKDLAEENGLHPVTVRNRAAAEEWLQARDEFATKSENARLNKMIEELAGRAAAFLAAGLSPADYANVLAGLKNARAMGRVDVRTTNAGTLRGIDQQVEGAIVDAMKRLQETIE